MLNHVLGEEASTIEWLDSKQPEEFETLFPDRPPWPLMLALREANRWAELGRLLRNPLDELATVLDTLESTRGIDDPDGHVREANENWARNEVEILRRSLKAAGRAEEVLKLEAETPEFLVRKDATRRA